MNKYKFQVNSFLHKGQLAETLSHSLIQWSWKWCFPSQGKNINYSDSAYSPIHILHSGSPWIKSGLNLTGFNFLEKLLFFLFFKSVFIP